MIVLDTSILSLVYRRKSAGHQSDLVDRVQHFIEDDVALAVPGIVLQELLTGLRSSSYFDRLEFLMGGFEVLEARRDDHRDAARISNSCSKSGVATSTVDALIAAQTVAARGKLFTLDDDFERIAQHSSLELYSV